MKHYLCRDCILFLLVYHCVETRGLPQGSVGNGTFQNLDFESANVTPPGSGQFYVPFPSAFPGWSGFIGPYPTSQAAYNAISIGAPLVVLEGPGRPSSPLPIIQGQYSALLTAGTGGPNLIPLSASLSQTGVIPGGAESLQIKFGGSSAFTVTLGGQSIFMFPLSMTPTYTLYGGSISGFAGKSENLTITALATTPGMLNGVELDDVTFSGQFVPEPATLTLLGLSCFVFIWSLKHFRKLPGPIRIHDSN